MSSGHNQGGLVPNHTGAVVLDRIRLKRPRIAGESSVVVKKGTAGDLFYDTVSNLLQIHNGTTFVAMVQAGAGVVTDTIVDNGSGEVLVQGTIKLQTGKIDVGVNTPAVVESLFHNDSNAGNSNYKVTIETNSNSNGNPIFALRIAGVQEYNACINNNNNDNYELTILNAIGGSGINANDVVIGFDTTKTDGRLFATQAGADFPGGVYNNGTRILGGQSAAVADASGGVVVDVEARAAINALLSRLRVHGLLAT